MGVCSYAIHPFSAILQVREVLKSSNERKHDMKTVTSKDGTVIAYDQLGEGSPVILVSGALGGRSHPMFTGLAEQLAPHFNVINYDRRGRGDSTDTPPYAVEREIEDIEALIDEAGGSAFLYGLSSGAALPSKPRTNLPPWSRSWHCMSHHLLSTTAIRHCQKITWSKSTQWSRRDAAVMRSPSS
jgi:hypothetical protein